MITEKQYNLLCSVGDGIEMRKPFPDEWKDVERFLYATDYYDLICTYGVKRVPYRWALNAEGIEQKRLFERKEQKAFNRQNRKDNIKKLCYGNETKKAVTLAVITGIIGLFFYIIQSLIKV